MSKAAELAALIGSQTALSNRNLIINGAMQVAQRGTSFNSNNAIDYTVDRWGTFANGQITTTQETFTAGQTAVPNEPTHYVRWNVTSYSSGDNFFQKIEDVRTLAGQSATLSFYAKSDTDITTRPRFIQDFGSGGSSDVVTTTDTASITTSWQKFVITTAIPSISGKTIGTSSYLEIELLRVTDTFTGQIDLAQVQLEVGEQATPFEHRSYGDELFSCQRYYQRTQSFMGAGHSVSGVVGISHLHRAMRATPTLSQDGVFVITDGYSIDATQSSTGAQITANNINTTGYYLYIQNISGLTAGKPYMSRLSNANGLLYDAEL
jgi:hypothetical protein